MSKYGHIKNLKCFPQVAAVIGPVNAQRELWKVVHNKDSNIDAEGELLAALNGSKPLKNMAFGII